ncbi:unnamed protein product [Adineta ricciae]|uniref:Uncharacterized protein n=1 Tax=Adineta ricciae TaxID=249248 RepID=A0A814XSA5_ADIRI|nr:unnamed protein product [Adineta ricciae]
MPPIHGLPALIAMIFAPTMELRLDEGQLKTCVLCGLDFNPVTNTSLYLDHDMDIGFDVQISTEDLINKIRKQMNLALYSAESAENNDLMRSINQDDRIPKMTEDVSPDHLRLFPLHDNAIVRTVKSDNEYRRKMMCHLI